MESKKLRAIARNVTFMLIYGYGGFFVPSAQAKGHPHRHVMSRRGQASIHPYPGISTAARGCHRGSVLLVWDPRFPSRKIRVPVVDANGHKMTGWGRVLDMSPEAFKMLYGKKAVKKGHLPVAYKVIRQGTKPWCGNP